MPCIYTSNPSSISNPSVYHSYPRAINIDNHYPRHPQSPIPSLYNPPSLHLFISTLTPLHPKLLKPSTQKQTTTKKRGHQSIIYQTPTTAAPTPRTAAPPRLMHQSIDPECYQRQYEEQDDDDYSDDVVFLDHFRGFFLISSSFEKGVRCGEVWAAARSEEIG
ncbi:hypothetical protein L207DRAFT_263324 [Hyaloscypha variabilis F]|uniref:Uncharacterized protein n=1 Tax=Hyaloscypha variabilis (strain UAMH 11265 / GT02V1 / F) TaxID=1149755 RepID=A0A2J6QS52_HYAVF|nr:hypothetical protein L207DRAFT_263324 [Hyaloscypha variabilis F]